jgi:hypothetical protein
MNQLCCREDRRPRLVGRCELTWSRNHLFCLQVLNTLAGIIQATSKVDGVGKARRPYVGARSISQVCIACK